MFVKNSSKLLHLSVRQGPQRLRVEQRAQVRHGPARGSLFGRGPPGDDDRGRKIGRALCRTLASRSEQNLEIHWKKNWRLILFGSVAFTFLIELKQQYKNQYIDSKLPGQNHYKKNKTKPSKPSSKLLIN